MERVMGIEPTQPAWKAGTLPLSYTRVRGPAGAGNHGDPKPHRQRPNPKKKSGAVDEIRTRDIHLGKVALYH